MKIIILNISYPSLKGCACSGEEGNGILKGKFGKKVYWRREESDSKENQARQWTNERIVFNINTLK